MDIKNALKSAFPPPIMPQKRYLFAAAAVGYFVLKMIVVATPTTIDDKILEKIHEVVLQMIVAQEPVQPLGQSAVTGQNATVD